MGAKGKHYALRAFIGMSEWLPLTRDITAIAFADVSCEEEGSLAQDEDRPTHLRNYEPELQILLGKSLSYLPFHSPTRAYHGSLNKKSTYPSRTAGEGHPCKIG